MRTNWGFIQTFVYGICKGFLKMGNKVKIISVFGRKERLHMDIIRVLGDNESESWTVRLFFFDLINVILELLT